ncbi:RNaseH domain-containing protein [Streptomyces sp. NBC_00690]|uniref:RNaseH domain-containing protein n=1 Tax=Streptomyces sp. NBC_00690 TaxID=2975808 RepID=UPI002E2B09CF|nr:RNaseH domain-containing protein [Streptomyces sp. NBC_00690]
MTDSIASLPSTLTLRCTPALVQGQKVYVRIFPRSVRDEWEKVKGNGDDRQKNLPYSTALTYLKFKTGGYVHLHPYLNYLVSLEKIDDDTLRHVFRCIVGYSKGLSTDQAILLDVPPVADAIANTTEQEFEMTRFLKPMQGKQPKCPDWMYVAVPWVISKKLAEQQFTIYDLVPITEQVPAKEKDGSPKLDAAGEQVYKNRTIGWKANPNKRKVSYLPDSRGGLIAWDHPFGRKYNVRDGGTEVYAATKAQYAMSRLSVAMKTEPNVADPVIFLDAHVTRVHNNMVSAKSTHVYQGSDGLPILYTELTRNGGVREVNQRALELLARDKMDVSLLQQLQTRVTQERAVLEKAAADGEFPSFITPDAGDIRPLMPVNDNFAVGTGPGTLHLRLLAEHVAKVLGEKATWVDFSVEPMNFEPRPTDKQKMPPQERASRIEAGELLHSIGFPPPEEITASVNAQGFEQLRIVCLWYRHSTRLRMINALSLAFPDGTPIGDPEPGKEVFLTPSISVIFRKAERFLSHGDDINRAVEFKSFEDDFADSDSHVMVGLWCETEIPTLKKKEGEKRTAFLLRKERYDGKFQVRRFLAKKDFVCQFTKGMKPGTFGNPSTEINPPKPGKDHAAYMALLDLYRSLGIIDQRLARALAKDKKGQEAGELVYCGIHARRQTKTADGKHTKRIIIATALFPPEEEGNAWTMKAWTPLIGAWVPYREAITAFHASDYALHVDGKGETDKERWAEAAAHVEEALASLVSDELEPGMGYVVMVDGHACRRMWTGLHNENQSYQEEDITDPRTWLPGYGKGKNAPRRRPAAVIRMNVDSDEVPQYVPVPRESDPDTEKESILFASAKLHRAAVDFGNPFWILFNIPRNYQAKGGDLGKAITRWDADPGKGGEEGERETNELKSPWWAVTATEIYPVGVANGVDRTTLARATARLCHQTIAWADRSRYPVPLHAAKQMDLDHPQYRRSAPPEEQGDEASDE